MLFLLLLPAIVNSFVSYKKLIFGNGTYDKEESPYDVTREFMAIYLQPSYVILVNVEENQQLVSFVGCYNYTWKDPRLAYDPEIIGSNYTVIPTSLIWLPWIYCYNCVEVKMLEKNSPSDDAIVSPDGTVSTYIRARFDTVCTCDISAFPFDTQYCGINLDGGWNHFDKMNYFPVYDPILQQTLITMGVTGLLGLTFLLSILVQEVPRSKNLPLIGKWLLIEMFICIFAMAIISPMTKLKRRYFEKRSFWTQLADVAAFLAVFGVNGLTTLFMLLFPGDLKSAPNKPF